jgi:hypothetical protein
VNAGQCPASDPLLRGFVARKIWAGLDIGVETASICVIEVSTEASNDWRAARSPV